MKMTHAEFAMVIRYIVQNEKIKNSDHWRVPAMRTLRDIKFMGLREAKMLIDSVDDDPVIGMLKSLYQDWV